ncbi:TPA: CBS domain-containing protein [Candidatus Micrarchaeota archaeon]|nr:CBS domain-containing protein [Candidatus Micrarchaeota archaeon]
MKTSLVTIAGEAPVFEAAVLMRDKKVGSLLVKNGNKIDAIASERDLVVKALAVKKCDLRVKDVSSKPLISVSSEADLSEAAKRMGDNDVKRLVVTEGGKIVGILSQKDIIRISPSLYDLIAERSSVEAPAGLPR